MSNRLPEQFINEILLRRLDRMRIDPDQTLPEDFDDTLIDDEKTLTEDDKKTLQFFK